MDTVYFDASNYWFIFVLTAAACYLIGSCNFAVIVSKMMGRDIRKIGSGNPGTMNMFREFGWGIAALTFFLDAFKGGIPALVSYFVFRNYVFSGTEIIVSDFTRYLCGLFVIIGHIFPVFYKFKGGKGIASSLGLFWICLACEKWWLIFVGFVWLVLVLLYIVKIHWGSMGSLMGVAGFSFAQAAIFAIRYTGLGYLSSPWVVSMFMMLLLYNVLTWAAHRKNIVRLLSGEEHLTGAKHKNKEKSLNSANPV